MDAVNKTLYIPLYGKAYVSQKGILLYDPKAEAIWKEERFPLKGKAASKWLAYYMGMRSAVFDQWVLQQCSDHPEAIILHLGCGMDSRASRLGLTEHAWYDVDFPNVIQERKRYYEESAIYHMLPGDLRELSWLSSIMPQQTAILVMEGVSMYLTLPQLQALFLALSKHFSHIHLLMDCYTPKAARLSRYKNPINEVGVTQVYGLESPSILPVPFVAEWDMTPERLLAQLSAGERCIFRPLFAGSFAKSLYRLYEYAN